MRLASTDATTWAERVIASMTPGGAALMAVPMTTAQEAALREVASREGWGWATAEESALPSGTRSVVIAGAQMAPETVAGAVLQYARRGVRSMLVLGRRLDRSPRRSARPLTAREACSTYGTAVSPNETLQQVLALWRTDGAAPACRALKEMTARHRLSTGIATAHDLVVLESLIAWDSGALFDAEALARAALLAAMLGPADEVRDATARLALARALLEQRHFIAALGAIERITVTDPVIQVLAHALHVRLALGCGSPAVAGRHVAALERLPGLGGWSTVHLWDARARLRCAVHDGPGVREACARGEALAARRGWRRRVARFGALRAALGTGREREGDAGDMRRWIVVDDLVAVLETCQEQADEVTAITRVGARVMARLGACGVVVVAARDGGAGAVLGACGVVAEMPAWLPDVMATGVRRPIDAGSPRHCAAPIRAGGRVVGVLLCEWGPGALAPIAETATLVDTAATALGPVVGALVERRMQVETGDALLAELVGGSQVMQSVRGAVLRASTSPFPVLIEGESGSGKELVARAVHRLSPRRARRFVALNCAAMSDELVEAELFGHARGAYTGAVGERAGLFEEASDGTLFLDEVAELSPRAQAKLLRVLQEGEVRRVGENRARRVDVRVVAASNRPLAAEAAAGRYRSDLLYRLDVIRITVPPLRARLDDLPLLAAHLWREVAARAGCQASLGSAVVDALGRYDWPGNVRELQNVLAMLAVAAPKRGVVPASVLPGHLVDRAAPAPERLSLDRARREFDAQYVSAAMRRAGGRRAVAARELGLTRQGLAKLMTRLRLERRASGVQPRAT
jgi:two-component system, NtrC family, response regulator HydG